MTHLSAVAIAFTVCLTAAYYVRNTIQSRQAWSKISTHTFDGFDDKQRYITDLKSLLRSGYAKYSRNNELFKIKNPAGGFWVVLPRSKIEEVKNASTRSFSFILAMRQALQIYFTGAPDRADWSAKVVRTDVNKNLDGIVRKTMGPVIDACFRENLPADGEAWQRVDIFDFFRNCVASITNETFVGPDLSSDVEWVEATKRFASDIWAASFSITRYSSYRRYLACFFLPSIKRLDQDKKLAERKLASRFDQRIAAQTISSSKTPDDTFQWLLDAAGPHVAFKEFTHTIVRLFMAAIFTTAQTATIALLDLLSQPEYIPELIQEIHENLQGDEIDIKSLDKLRKLDSFLKESQRMSPVALVSFGRKLPRAYTFQDGLTLPAGALVCAPTEAILADPEFDSSPTVFDGYRYVKLREQSQGAEKRYEFGTAVEENFEFWHRIAGVPREVLCGQ